MHDSIVWRLHGDPDVPNPRVLRLQAPMFKAPALAYAPAASDFLLRHASGRMALRRFQGTVALGQQEPHVRVPAPQSKEKRCKFAKCLGFRVRLVVTMALGQQEPHVRAPQSKG